jgi:glutaredoxin
MSETLTTAAREAAMPFSFLTSWWRRRSARPLSRLRFVLYTRRGCHLCEDARQRLREAQQAYGFALEVKDVDEDPDLAARYGEQVPVVTVNGKERFRGGVNPVLLSRLLTAENR